MSTIKQIAGLFLFSLFPLISLGQTYEKWWKEVETLQQKDLPKSVIEIVDKIYDKAKAEKNLPQMMKAWMMKADCRGRIAPDSVETDRKYLEEWAGKETDVVGCAVLNSLLGSELSELGKEEDMDRAISFFRRSLRDKEILGNTPATDFVPMTKTGRLSEQYLGNSMYDLLVREAVRSLSRTWNWCRQERVQEEIVRMYDDLLVFYEGRNREATLITLLAKAEWQVQKGIAGMRFRLTDGEYGQLLDTWMKEYKDLDVCAYLYLKRSMLYERKKDYAKAHDLAKEGLKKFPKSEAATALTEQVKRIETPELNVNIPFIYPEHEAEVHVSYKNLTAVKVELYRLNLNPASSVLYKGEYDETFVRKYGERVKVQSWILNPTEDYRQTDTLIHYRMPESGIYLLKLIPDRCTDKAVYSVLHVSPYQCAALPAHNQYYELIALDKLSGQPVPEAEIVTYKDNDEGYEVVGIYATNEKGSVTVKVPNRRLLWCNVRTPGNDFMAIGMLSVYRNWREERKETWENRVSLFTDRSLYRPGQCVHVSGVVYRQCGDSLQVVANEKSELILRLHDKELAKTEVCTDAWGTFSGELILPQHLLPGEAEIAAYGKSEYVKVEEYKRPTFDVTFVPYGKAYAVGDSVRIEGKAHTFAGVPVRKATVDFDVVREKRWFWMPSGRERDKIQTGKIETGEDGRFILNICLTQSDTEPEAADMRMYYTYTVTARVTGEAGETQEGMLVLPVGNCSLGLQIEGLNEKMVREEENRIVFHALNLNGMPVVTDVVYRVLAAKEKTDTLYEGKIMSEEAFIPREVWKLPSGSYRMEVSARDDLGRECKAEQNFVLFSRADTRPPIETVEWFYQDKNGWSDSDSVNLYVGSSEDSVYLFVDVYTTEKRIESKRMYLSNEVVKLSYPYRTEYGNGITVHMAFLRKGQWYNRQVNLVRSEPDKRLQLKWETFRDRLQPGEQEEWRLQILDKEGHPADANLMAVLYDASLDKLYTHHWYFNLFFNRFAPYLHSSVLWHGQQVSMYCPFPYSYVEDKLRVGVWGDYSRLWKPGAEWLGRSDTGGLAAKAISGNAVKLEYASSMKADAGNMVFEEEMLSENRVSASGHAFPEDDEIQETVIGLPLRENFAETVFFYPQLRTDTTGQVSMVFTMPDALTTWKWMGFAHTKTMDYGVMTDTVVTSKPFMVQPNLPRFMRVGDQASIATSLVNLSTDDVKGTAYLQLIDPMTEKVVYSGKKKFHIGKGETGMIRFAYQVSGDYEVLVCKIVAEAGNYTDGEQHYVPVLADKQWVTETIPVQIEGEDTVLIDTKPFFNRQSPTAADKRLTVELTANPDWYVVQALPVLGNPVSEDAISWATAYYANCLSAYIVKANPRIGKVLESWRVSGKKEEYGHSGIEKNEDLKDLLVEESPWLAEALQEAEQKQKIAGLFDRNGLENSMNTAIGRLEKLQQGNGSWSWYKGMEGNLYVTTTVAVTMARLRAMTGYLDKEAESMYERAVSYLRKQVEKDYERMQHLEKKGQQVMPRQETLAYLYMNALDAKKVGLPEQRIVTYLLERLENYSAGDIFEKSVIALIMQAGGRKKKAEELIQSVKEYTVYARDMGRYFDTRKAAYSWNDYRIPTQTVAMEAIRKIAPDTRMENEMKYWLLRQKQAQVWSTPIATANAVYAFLCMGDRRLEERGEMKATVDGIVCQTPQDAFGYTRCTLEGAQAEAEQIVIEKTGNGIGWATVYVQYTELMDCLQEEPGDGLSVKKEYQIDGKTINGETKLKPGDKLTVRLIIRSDRDMDFVRVKDERAACMEPASQLSGYVWTGGLGCYRVSRDASTEFFIDRLRKGTYVLEYEVYIDRSGTYQAGVASVQSVYAPEFAGHTGGEDCSLVVR